MCATPRIRVERAHLDDRVLGVLMYDKAGELFAVVKPGLDPAVEADLLRDLEADMAPQMWPAQRGA